MTTDEERGKELLAQFKQDLQQLAMQGEYGQRAGIVILGMLDVVEVLIRRAVRVDPELLPGLLTRISDMNLRVAEQRLLDEEDGHDEATRH